MPEVVLSSDNRVTCSKSTTSCTFRDYRSRYMVAEMKATEQFYNVISSRYSKNYAFDFEQCCTGAWFVRDNKTSLVKVISHKCKLRWCPICAKNKAYNISKAVEESLKPNAEIRLLTLTLKDDGSGLISSSNRIYKCFQRLRKTSKFKKFVSGGIWFYQLKYGQKNQNWHPHIHCLITGKYFKKAKIKELWQKITGDSYVIDIRYAQNKKKVLAYVSRYVSRPVALSDCPIFEYRKLFDAFRSRKLCGSWGNLRGVDLRGSKKFLDGQLVKIGSWSTVHAFAAHDGNAILILDRWKNQTPLPAYVTCIQYDDLIAGVRPYKARAAPDPWLFQ